MLAPLRQYPRSLALAFGLGLLALLWALAEAAAWRLLAPNRAQAIEIWKNDWQEDHPHLGYRPKADFTGQERKWRGDDVFYDVHYTFDSYHRRRTPMPAGALPDQFAIFFGDSFTMGQGVSDGETLPAHFAARAPRFHAYNYGCGGYGPQNMWVHLHRDEFPGEVRESTGLAIYTYIEPQLYRAIGALPLLAVWGKRLPYLDPAQDRLAFRGLYEEIFPMRTRFATLAMKSPVVQFTGLLAPRPRPDHYVYTARILRESRDRLRELFPGAELYVLLFPAAERPAPLIAELAAQSVPVLDHIELLHSIPPEPPLALGDGHPTGRNYGLVAEALARDLDGRP